MIHLDDSNVYDVDNGNENDMVNLPSPISLQLVNSNSRSYKSGYGSSDHVNCSDDLLSYAMDLFFGTISLGLDKGILFLNEIDKDEIRELRGESGISEAVFSNVPVASTVPQPFQVDGDHNLQFDNYNNLSRQVLSSFEYNTFVPKSLSSSRDSYPIVDFVTLDDESAPELVAAFGGGIHTRIVAGQTSGMANIKRVRCRPARRVGFTSPRLLGEVSYPMQSVSDSIGSTQSDVGDISKQHWDAQLSVFMADEEVSVSHSCAVDCSNGGLEAAVCA